MKLKKQRSDKEANSDLIRNACLQILQEKKGRKPTVKELSLKTGLSASAVKGHLKTMSFKGQTDDVCTLKILTDDVKLSLYRHAMKGNMAAAKLWFQIVEGWNERTEHKVEAKVQVENKPPVIVKFSRDKRRDNEPPIIYID